MEKKPYLHISFQGLGLWPVVEVCLKFWVLFLALEQNKNKSSLFEQGLGCSPGSRPHNMSHAVFFCQSFCLSVSLMCVHAHTHSFAVCLRLAFVWSCVSLRLFYSVSSFCLPSVGSAGTCYCPAHSTVFSFSGPVAACWSWACETDAMKS